MCDNLQSNPFAALFSTNNDAFSSQHHAVDENSSVSCAEQSSDTAKDTKCTSTDSKVDQLVARVFGLTLRRDGNNPSDRPLVFIDADSIEHAVFERLILPNPAPECTYDNAPVNVDDHTVETQVMIYLYECYCRLKQYKVHDDLESTVGSACQIILRNASTALQEPELFQHQEVHSQFVTLFMDDVISKLELSSFVNGIVEELIQANAENVEDAIAKSFVPVLDIIRRQAVQSNLFTFRQQWFTLLHKFTTTEPLAKLLICHSKPKSDQGRAYADTLLGALFNISCLPKTAKDPYDFFDKPPQQLNAAMESTIWLAMNNLIEALEKMFLSLLKCSTKLRHMTLQWLGNCLYANANRGKLWNSHTEMGLLGVLCVSDGFMLNIGYVFLRLCQPFCIKLNKVTAKIPKVPKIDPTYCSAEAKTEAENLQRGVHMKGLTTETCLIPTPEGKSRPIADSYGFITECFFLTHRAMDLGYNVILDKLFRTHQELVRIQKAYNDARKDGTSLEVLELLSQQIESEMKKYLSLKRSLLIPEMLECLARFHAITAFWLTQVNLHIVDEEGVEQNFMPKQYTPVTFPLPKAVPITLRCIPEFVVENTIEFLCFLHRSSQNTFEEQGPSFLYPILTEIIVLMESQGRLYNPHLRARLAESLEALLPIPNENEIPTPNMGSFHREHLFINHPHKHHIIVNLLNVFVSIETGQNVQFEQKFNYRRPMYVIMDYLWRHPEYRNDFTDLAEKAKCNMEAVQPPLFLRFINLLMNDAVYLLDETLSNMAQLRQMLQARENGEWNELPENEREQQEDYLQHIGMTARFDNILGRKTIHTIKLLTTEIKMIFCHPTMVDRMASMLNYLLLQLVGPNKKNLKVNDQTEYSFNPANLVLNICQIYINLSESERFILAVSQDGRSYSTKLFKLAESVLVRIGGVPILGDLNQFARRVEKIANQKREEDEILAGAPEEFLDPIMSTIMTDPVILPSSKISIDRQTIARHVLSDQTDPFNRSPLTMDMVKPNVELKKKIQEWMLQRKREKVYKL